MSVSLDFQADCLGAAPVILLWNSLAPIEQRFREIHEVIPEGVEVESRGGEGAPSSPLGPGD